jgi:hypothetical protein
MGASDEQGKLGAPAVQPDTSRQPAQLKFIREIRAAEIFAGCAFVVSSISLWITIHQNNAVDAIAVASTFSTLRARYHEVDAKLPTDYTSPNVRYAPKSKSWEEVRRYWDTAFDEWFVSTQLKGVDDLWTKFYAEAIGLSLRYPAMRAVYCDLGYGGQNQTTMRREFHAAIREVFASIEPGTALCPVQEPYRFFHS